MSTAYTHAQGRFDLIRRFYHDIARAEKAILDSRFSDASRIATQLKRKARIADIPFTVYRAVYDRVVYKLESLGF